jgi:hypothetical protein
VQVWKLILGHGQADRHDRCIIFSYGLYSQQIWVLRVLNKYGFREYSQQTWVLECSQQIWGLEHSQKIRVLRVLITNLGFGNAHKKFGFWEYSSKYWFWEYPNEHGFWEYSLNMGLGVLTTDLGFGSTHNKLWVFRVVIINSTPPLERAFLSFSTCHLQYTVLTPHSNPHYCRIMCKEVTGVSVFVQI